MEMESRRSGWGTVSVTRQEEQRAQPPTHCTLHTTHHTTHYTLHTTHYTLHTTHPWRSARRAWLHTPGMQSDGPA
jgi:hypothetical protein